jgi:hypothetical protein
MGKIFSALFRNNLIRLLTSRMFWSGLWSATKRAHKDKRARQKLLVTTFIFIALIAYLVYVIYAIGSGGFILLLFALPLLWWIRRQAKKEDEPMHIAPVIVPRSEKEIDEESWLRRQFFVEVLVLYAVLADRASSENFLKTKEVPEGHEIITRSRHIELLKALGLWERMAQRDREIIMQPDGHWEAGLINQMALNLEVVMVLRWMLGIDFILFETDPRNKASFTRAHELLMSAQKLIDGEEVKDDLLPVFNYYRNLFYRCYAELIKRNVVRPDEVKVIEWGQKYAGELEGKQDVDIVIGSHVVSELTDEEVQWTATVARVRANFLIKAKNWMNIPEVWSAEFDSISVD